MKIGFHVSIEGSVDKAVDRALKLGCNTFQIFTKNPRQWMSRALTSEETMAFTEKVQINDVKPVFGHMAYLPNLASSKDAVYSRSVTMLILELKRCHQLKIPYLVIHLGSHLGAGVEFGFTRIINAIDRAFEVVDGSVMLLLENSAGSGNSMGSSFEELEHIMSRLFDSKRVGICFDTCHAFAAGYDLRSQKSVEATLRAFDTIIGFGKLKLVHLNDSKGDLNSHIDRHEHIGEGRIGDEGIRNVLESRLGQFPLILETPRDEKTGDIENLRKVHLLSHDL
ncbi:MAG: deoxyribonuclease IV [Candidatus Bathyarchaeota archaeon]|nr:deoxyribonuclease IV [Candidatus Bathyarchaeota archaeon]